VSRLNEGASNGFCLTVQGGTFLKKGDLTFWPRLGTGGDWTGVVVKGNSLSSGEEVAARLSPHPCLRHYHFILWSVPYSPLRRCLPPELKQRVYFTYRIKAGSIQF